MSDKLKFRTKFEGSKLDVKILFSHPMETGLRKDANGKIMPLHFIKEAFIYLNNKLVLKNNWSQGISKNPFLGLKIKSAKVGDILKVEWIDNKGLKESQEFTISA